MDNALKLSVEVMIKSLERSFDFTNGWFLRRMLFKCINFKICFYKGSGKTLAFGIPILTHILGQKTSQEAGETTENATKNNATEATETGTGTSKLKKPLLALIMTPTRELAIQIKNHLKQAAKHTSLEVNFMYLN